MSDREATDEMLDERFKLLEERIDSQEELIANLLMAYTEMASHLETTIQEVMSPREEIEKEKFRQALNQRHAEMLQMIREVANEVEDRGPASSGESILTMAARQQAASADSGRDSTTGDEG